MPNRTYHKIFSDHKKLEMMLQLRRKGWTYVSLATVYGVDFSSIYNQCKKHQVAKAPATLVFNIPTIISLTGLKTKRVKNYADYLREAREREVSQLHLRSMNNIL